MTVATERLRGDSRTRDTKLESLGKGLGILLEKRGSLLLGKWEKFRPGMSDALKFELVGNGILITEIHKIPSRRIGDTTCGEENGPRTFFDNTDEFIAYLTQQDSMPNDVLNEMCENVAVALERLLNRERECIDLITDALRTEDQ
jgi:hypothetical protein